MINNQEHRDELLIAYLLGELNETQANEVSQWLAKSEENLLHFEHVTHIWNGRNNHSPKAFNSAQAWKRSAQRW
jgi:anti-sigma factor RsiW